MAWKSISHSKWTGALGVLKQSFFFFFNWSVQHNLTHIRCTIRECLEYCKNFGYKIYVIFKFSTTSLTPDWEWFFILLFAYFYSYSDLQINNFKNFKAWAENTKQIITKYVFLLKNKYILANGIWAIFNIGSKKFLVPTSAHFKYWLVL